MTAIQSRKEQAMDNRPLVQVILEDDLLFRKLSGTNKEAAKQIAAQFVEASNYPLDTSRASSAMLGTSTFGSRVIEANVYSSIPGTSVISVKKMNYAITQVQKAFRRVNRPENIFNPDNKDAISWFLGKYHDQILSQIEKLPKILINEITEHSNITAGAYNCVVGEIEFCIDEKFKNLCNQLRKKILPTDSSKESNLPLLSALVRQIAIRTLTDVIPANAIEALKKINERFVFMVIVPNRIFWLPQKISLLKSKVEQQNNIKRFVLHCENGIAVKGTGETGLYYLRGRVCPKWVVEVDAPTLKTRIKNFFQLNVEQRRMILERLGAQAVVSALEAKIIDTKDDYKLIEVKIPGIRSWRNSRRTLRTKNAARFLQMKNPSVDNYHIEGVDNKCKTVDEALRWRNHDAETLPVALS